MQYIRDDLKDLIPYKAADAKYRVVLNSNESPFDLPYATKERLIAHIRDGNIFNRYPDPDATSLRNAIAHQHNVGIENLMVASGSDDLIQMIINTFVNKGEHVLCPNPSFSMYNIYTKIVGGTPIEVNLDKDFQYNMDAFLSAAKEYNAKIAFICNPNNPTGTTASETQIKDFIENFNGIVVIDEAYIEFYGKSSLEYVLDYNNVIVLRTFSKAFGLAGLRVGYMVANEDIIDAVYLTKSPYNINTFSQMAALELLKDFDEIEKRVEYIVEERERLYDVLSTYKNINVLPSSANFLLIKVKDPQLIYKRLIEKDIIVRSFSKENILSGYIRVSIGSREENDRFLGELINIVKERS